MLVFLFFSTGSSDLPDLICGIEWMTRFIFLVEKDDTSVGGLLMLKGLSVGRALGGFIGGVGKEVALVCGVSVSVGCLYDEFVVNVVRVGWGRKLLRSCLPLIVNLPTSWLL